MIRRNREIKCIAWDLDNTLWHGVLLEGGAERLRDGIRALVRTLDERGILMSIASRNDHDLAMRRLSQFGLDAYFLCPQITWGVKSASLRAIARNLNLGTDALAFIDDDAFERGEVAASLPEVLCIDAADLDSVADMPEMNPTYITVDSRRRRSMYLAEMERQDLEVELPANEFLASLRMVLTISEAEERDLARVEELTMRTHQLNSTGRAYSIAQLGSFCRSEQHKLLLAGLDDRYGTYGKIGVALVERTDEDWLVRLFLMSCRVMGRGVGNVFLGHILRSAAEEPVRVRAEFLRTERNRAMYLTFKLAGFREMERYHNLAVLEHDLGSIDPFPDFLEVRVLA
jgi:FkbH-like protein